MQRLQYHKTKKGVASLYVVIFATILFGVITLSFVRIILSEATQSSNDDLSQSAYDSALAGVEDAKIAVNKYYECLSNGFTGDCAAYKNRQLFGGECKDFYLRSFLYPTLTEESEVKVAESQSADGNSTDQAYTCVILNDTVADYRGTLSSDNRTKVIPLGINRSGTAEGSELNKVRSIEISWYSELNGTVFQNTKEHNGKFADKNHSTVPPTVSLTFLRTGNTINPALFNDSTDGNYSTMVFLPSSTDNNDAVNSLTYNDIRSAGNSNNNHEPFQVKCDRGSEFACNVSLTNLEFNAGDNAILVVSLPYGDTNTDFRITMKDADNNAVNFQGVQISVDSTGRANQLYRRVETRLDPSDSFFPYPEYELDLGGGKDGEALNKNFWITSNCWTESGPCNNNGKLNN